VMIFDFALPQNSRHKSA